MSLAQAREQAFELRRKLKHEKIDPLEHRRAAVVGARIAALTGATFEQVARRCIEMKTSEWRGDGSRREWLSTLERYAFPVLGRCRSQRSTPCSCIGCSSRSGRRSLMSGSGCASA